MVSDLTERLRHAHVHSAQRIMGSNIFEEAANEIERLTAALAEAYDARASHEEIAEAWKAWHSRHGGKIGPGPAFVEAIHAAFKCRARALKEKP